jgi:hypothetical protein
MEKANIFAVDQLSEPELQTIAAAVLALNITIMILFLVTYSEVDKRLTCCGDF